MSRRQSVVKRILRAVVVLTLSLAWVPATPAGDFFVGAAVGQSQTRDTLAASTFEAEETAWEAWFGYQLMPFVFFEASYIDFGTFEDTQPLAALSSDVEGAVLWAAGRVPIGSVFSFYVKLGFAHTEADTVLSRPLQEPMRTTRNENSIAWGAGLGVDLGKRFTIRLEFDSYQVESSRTLEFLSVGAQINF